jgi:opacity protein-like surface antigen
MKQITLVLLLLTATTTFAQQLYIEGGKTLSSFDYKNSQGDRLDNLQATTHSFMTVGYRKQIFTKNLNLSLAASYASYGAIGSDDTLDNYMEWDVNYVGLNVDLDYHLFHIKKASVYVKGGMSGSFLVQGTQTINNRVIDLKNEDDFDTTMIAMQAGVGFSHPISEHLSFYAQYMYGKSMDVASGNETLKIKSNNLSFGLLIDISKKERTETKKSSKI